MSELRPAAVILTAHDLGAIVGVSERRIRELRDQGVIPDNGQGRYILGEAVAAYCAHLRPSQGRAAAGGSAEDLDLTVERARKAKEEADRLEMQNAQMRHQLLARADVDAAVTAAFARVRARLIGLAAKLAPILMTLQSAAEAQAAIREAINGVLRELSETTVADLCGDDGDVVEAPGPTTRPDGEPVG